MNRLYPSPRCRLSAHPASVQVPQMSGSRVRDVLVGIAGYMNRALEPGIEVTDRLIRCFIGQEIEYPDTGCHGHT